MTQLERIESEINTAKAELAAMTRGCAILPPGAKKLADRIERLKEKRNSIIVNSTSSLGECLPEDEAQRNEVYRLLIKLPLVADFLYASCVDLQSVLNRYKLTELTITRKVNAIRQQSKELAFMLSQFVPLEQILSADDALIDSLDRKVSSFLDYNMRIVNDENDKINKITE